MGSSGRRWQIPSESFLRDVVMWLQLVMEHTHRAEECGGGGGGGGGMDVN